MWPCANISAEDTWLPTTLGSIKGGAWSPALQLFSMIPDKPLIFGLIEIHHVDMHMKLLDEETILVGEYPEGVSDYYLIESNIACSPVHILSG